MRTSSGSVLSGIDNMRVRLTLERLLNGFRVPDQPIFVTVVAAVLAVLMAVRLAESAAMGCGEWQQWRAGGSNVVIRLALHVALATLDG